MQPQIESFRNAGNPWVAHVVYDPISLRGAIINATLDDAIWGGTAFVERILSDCDRRRLVIDWILETDLIPAETTAVFYLRHRAQAVTATGASGVAACSGRYDHLFFHEEQFPIGALNAVAVRGSNSNTTTFHIEDFLLIGRLHSGADYTVHGAARR